MFATGFENSCLRYSRAIVTSLVAAVALFQPSVATAQTGKPAIEIVPPGPHVLGIDSAAISSDGRLIATDGEDALIKLWDVKTKRFIRNVARIDEEHKFWRVLALSTDGRRVLGLVSGEYKFWDSVSGKELISLDSPPHDGPLGTDSNDSPREPQFTVMSDDGRSVAGVVDERKIKLFNGETGQEITTLADHTGPVVCMTFGPDGKTLASAAKDNTVRLWEAASGKPIQTIKLQAAPRALSYARDGRYLLADTADGFELWDSAGDKQVWKHDDTSFKASHLSQDGASILVETNDANRTEIWDIAKQTRVASFVRSNGSSFLGFSSDLKLAYFSSDGIRDGWAIRSVEVATGKSEDIVGGADHYSAIDGAGRFAIVVSDEGLDIRDLSEGKRFQKFNNVLPLNAVAVSASGSRVVIEDGEDAFVGDAVTAKLVNKCNPFKQDIKAFGFSKDERRLLVGGEDNAVSLCDLDAGKLVRSYQGHTDTVTAVAFSADGQQILSGDNQGDVKLWDVTSGKIIHAFKGNDRNIHRLAFTPDGKRLLAGTDDNKVRIWDKASGREVQTLRMLVGPVEAMSLSTDGRRVAAGPYGELMAKQWDIASGKELRKLEAGIEGRFILVEDVAYSHASGLLAATSNNRIVVWAIDSGRKLFEIEYKDQTFKSLAFSADDKRIISVDQSGMVRHWDAKTGALLLTVDPGGKEWLRLTPEGFFDASPDGARLLTVVRGVEVYPIDKVYDQLYRPDLVAEKLAGDPKGLVRDAAAKLDLAAGLTRQSSAAPPAAPDTASETH
jgi:WD40 repeat protein